MKKYLLLLVCMMLTCASIAQYKNNKWLMGGGNLNPLPWCCTKIEFTENSRTVTTETRSMGISGTFSGISDKDDNWFVYTNGTAICNKNHDTLVNGGGLSPGGDFAGSISGIWGPEESIFFPKDTLNNRYYLFHANIKTSANGFPLPNRPRTLQLYYSIIDPIAANGIGQVIKKNKIAINDTLELINKLAVRHANGRDWWVIVKRFYTDLFYSILVTPDSVYAPISYSTQSPNFYIGGQSTISPNGKYWATFANSLSQLRIFDIDRCTGIMSNPRYKFISNGLAAGVSFSPNSRFLYVAKFDTLWQFDMEATDILASQTFIAAYDGYISNGQYTTFDFHWLASDGKIYVNSRNQSLKLHVINNPDMPGQACDFQQHAVDVPSYYSYTSPTPINLALYHLPGSPCDTLGVGRAPLNLSKGETLKIMPNPSDGRFSVEYTPQRMSGMLYLYDVNGREVFREYVSPFTSVKNVDLKGKVHSGVYAVRLVWGNGIGLVGRVVVE